LILKGDEAKIYGRFSISLYPGNLEKNEKLLAPIEKKFKEFLHNNANFSQYLSLLTQN